MTTLSLESLGITSDELLNRVVDKIAEDILTDVSEDEDGVSSRFASRVQQNLLRKVQAMIDAAVTKLGDELVKPRVEELIVGTILQRTTEWGEKKGEPIPFTTYLVQRADAYMREEVNFEGRSRDESRDSYTFKKAGTRISYAIDKHLQFHMEAAMKQSLVQANSTIAEGITSAVKIKLGEVLAGLNVTASVKR